MVKVLFVCMGNICRSPTAEGTFRHIVEQGGLSDEFHIDSAGTIDFHIGDPPDVRAQETALRYGVDITRLRARQVNSNDFHIFDYVLAMDRENFQGLNQICPEGRGNRLHMFCDFHPDASIREVPDPYYGGTRGFDTVFDLVMKASKGLLEHIQKRPV